MNARLEQLGLGLLGAVIVISLAIECASLTWHLAGDVSSSIGAQAAPAAYAPVIGPPDLAPVLSLAPFGSAAPPPDAAPQETTLGLVLQGVVLADPPSRSSAVIAGTDGQAHVYAIGDTLPGAAVLDSVAADSVTLRVGGRLETLSFPKSAAMPSGVAAIRASIPASAGGGGPAAPRAPSAYAGKDADTIAQDFRTRIANNPQTVLNDVGMAATPEGYRLEETMMPELKRAGLKPGDLVVRVNGNKVGSIESDRKLFDEVVASGRARVEVMRDGSLIVMSFPLR